MNLITVICTLFPVLVFGGNSESDVRVKHEEYSYQDSSYDIYTLSSYTILNDSDDASYVTFVYSHEECNLEETIMRYFLSFHNDFSLMTLLTDNGVQQEMAPIIGKTFLKEITPKSEFKYTIVETEKVQDTIDSHLCIFIVDKVYIEDLLKVNLAGNVLFQKDEVVILQDIAKTIWSGVSDKCDCRMLELYARQLLKHNAIPLRFIRQADADGHS